MEKGQKLQTKKSTSIQVKTVEYHSARV